MDINTLIEEGRKKGCSDIHLTAELPPMYRYLGKLCPSEYAGSPAENDRLILSMLDEKQKKRLEQGDDLDFSWVTGNGLRQRVNVYRQMDHLCAAVRLLRGEIPSLEELDLPGVLKSLADEPRGLVLVTGPTGSGKSTTLAAMVDHVNQTRQCHIITIEDPIEYMHEHKNCMIHQREVGRDVGSFASALRSALREDPDIILVGEMRDYETISAAITAAETGHLVLSTLHTTGAAQTINRIIDVFPPHNQGQIRTQLGSVLKGVVTQALIPTADGKGRVAATEILIGTDAAHNLIREDKCHQIPSIMQVGMSLGMHTLDMDLARLVREDVISRSVALEYCVSESELKQYLQQF